MSKKERVNQPKNSNEIEYYLSTKNTSFKNLFCETKKYKELLWSMEAFLSLTIAVISCMAFYVLLKSNDYETLLSVSRSILLTLIGSLIGVLGFIIGGLAVLTGTISNDVLKKFSEVKRIKSVIGVLFSFYFTGFIIGITIFISIFTYIVSFSACEYPILVTYVWIFTVSYMFSFSIIYSIALLGSCLKMMLVRYSLYKSDD